MRLRTTVRAPTASMDDRHSTTRTKADNEATGAAKRLPRRINHSGKRANAMASTDPSATTMMRTTRAAVDGISDQRVPRDNWMAAMTVNPTEMTRATRAIVMFRGSGTMSPPMI
jgi:hypothetical protein